MRHALFLTPFGDWTCLLRCVKQQRKLFCINSESACQDNLRLQLVACETFERSFLFSLTLPQCNWWGRKRFGLITVRFKFEEKKGTGAEEKTSKDNRESYLGTPKEQNRTANARNITCHFPGYPFLSFFIIVIWTASFAIDIEKQCVKFTQKEPKRIQWLYTSVARQRFGMDVGNQSRPLSISFSQTAGTETLKHISNLVVFMPSPQHGFTLLKWRSHFFYSGAFF